MREEPGVQLNGIPRNTRAGRIRNAKCACERCSVNLSAVSREWNRQQVNLEPYTLRMSISPSFDFALHMKFHLDLYQSNPDP